MTKKYSGIYLNKNNNTYYVSTTFITKDGFEVRKCKRGFATQREAEAWKQKEKIKISNMELNVEEKKKTKLENMFEEYLKYQKLRVKPSTYEQKKSYLKTHFMPYFRTKNLNDLKPNEIQAFYEKLCNNDKTKITTKNYCIIEIRLFLEWLDLMDYIDNSTLKKFKRIVVKLTDTEIHQNDYLTQDEIKQLIDVVDTTTINGKERRLFYMLSCYAGLRIGETTGLKYLDVDTDANSIRVNKQIQYIGGKPTLVPYTKTNSIKYVDVPVELIEYIEEYKQLTGSSDDDFIMDKSRSQLRKYLVKDLAKANLKKIRIHDLRHSYCTMLYDMGADGKYVAKQMGHSNELTSKKTYEHLTESKAKKNKTKIIDNLMN